MQVVRITYRWFPRSWDPYKIVIGPPFETSLKWVPGLHSGLRRYEEVDFPGLEI